MTRRYEPRVIQASHFRTQIEEEQRERERPAPAVHAEPERPAAWEAKPDPEPARLPPYGRIPKGLSVPMLDSNSPALGMFNRALQQTSDPTIKRRLRAAQREMREEMAREMQDLPPGAHPSAYGL